MALKEGQPHIKTGSSSNGFNAMLKLCLMVYHVELDTYLNCVYDFDLF